MRFAKPARTLDGQIEHLRQRGMGGDLTELKRRLRVVNYYRLSAYWFTFRDSDRRFHPGTTFETIWERYTFDRQLRLLVMDGLERVEIAVRASLANQHALAHGPFDYSTDPTTLYAGRPKERAEFLSRLAVDLKNNRHETFLKHFRSKYGDMHDFPPIWVAVEVLTFGGIVSLFRGSKRAIQRTVADSFGLPDVVFDSWLLSLNQLRNICAHHGRLWNREFGLKPKLPRTKEWTSPVTVTRERAFGMLTILAYLTHIIDQGSPWPTRLSDLLSGYPDIPLAQMGFPQNWKQSPVWQRALNLL